MVEITLPVVLQIIQTVSISVGIIYYLFNMRNAQKTRELSLKAQEHATETRELDIYMRWQMELTRPDVMEYFVELDTLEWEDFDSFARKYSHNVNPIDASKRLAMWQYWNGLGYLHSRGVIDSDTVFEMAGNWCIGQWTKFEPIIQGFRERDLRPESWRWFEYLANEMKIIREQRGMPEYIQPWRPEIP
jgi:hypothetical protein